MTYKIQLLLLYIVQSVLYAENDNSVITPMEFNTKLLGIIVAIIFIIIFLPLFNKRKKGRSNSKQKIEKFVEDIDLLRQAEKALKEDKTVYVSIKKFSSAEGFKDTDMMRIISVLGSEGIEATYESHSIGMEIAAISYYHLKVKPEDREVALKIIKEKNL